jgi:hypothetical protein
MIVLHNNAIYIKKKQQQLSNANKLKFIGIHS